MLAGGPVLAEGDGCWVGTGVGEPPGLADWPGLPWLGLTSPGRPDGKPPSVPGRGPDGQW